MAKDIYDGTLFVHDVNFYEPNLALQAIMSGATGTLGLFLGAISLDVQLLYQGLVNVKSGQLKASAHAQVVSGAGHKHDRLAGKVTVGGEDAVGEWRGKPFYYGVLHDLGSPAKSGQFPAYQDLYDALAAYAGANGGVST